MEYKSNLQKSLDQYEALRSKYDALTNTEEFDYINSTLPFRFLRARYLSEILLLYQETTAQIQFKTSAEATQQYRDIVNFKHEKDDLLNHASFMAEVIAMKDEINELVAENPYLTPSMSLPSFGRIEYIVKDCLKETPNYNKLLNKEFRFHFIESCIASLPQNEIAYLLQSKVILNSDLDKVPLTGSDHYMNNLQYLREITGHTEICVKEIHTRIHGTTFLNEDGSNRQEYLQELSKALAEQTNIKLTAQLYDFIPDGGNPEPAIKIMWNHKCLGNISKDVVANIMKQYDQPYFKVEFEELIGGNSKGNENIHWGCKINLKVYAKQLLQENDKTEETPEK